MFTPSALLLLLPLRGKPQVGKGPGSHYPLHGEKETLETRRRGQERVGSPGVLFKGRGDATHPGPLGKGGGDSCIQLRLWKGHGGESSHCVPQESGGQGASLPGHCALPRPPAPISGSPVFFGGGSEGLALCMPGSAQGVQRWAWAPQGRVRLGVMRNSPTRRQFSDPSLQELP